MKITEHDLQIYIQNAENNNACQEQIKEIKNCKSVKEVLYHKNAIRWPV